MKKVHFIKALIIILTLGYYSCKNKPKVITAASKNNEKSKIFSTKEDGVRTKSDSKKAVMTNDFHQIKVNEILPTERYVYLNVDENGKKFWIATRKMDVEKGKTYFYKGGLLKRNFESKEYNRTFETIYLVSSLVASDHSKNVGEQKNKANKKIDIPTHTDKITVHKGSIKIAELVKNPKKYEGKTVQLSGRCTKVNPNIMKRNWIHLKDGSKDDFDLVLTSDSYVPEGSVITVKAKVSLNRDFGAGYKYDLILEDAVIIK